jgi:hypothetical protein
MEKNTKLIAGLMIAILAASALAIAPVIFAEEIDPDSFEASTQVGGAMNRRKVRYRKVPLLCCRLRRHQQYSFSCLPFGW